MMTLDERDQKLAAQLRKEADRWPSMRWALLILGLALVVIGIVTDEMISAIVGIGSIAYALQYWQGHPANILLLRLLDSARKTG